ncbi:MAG TPA: 3'(2'),5'-bisphosphate nucleotidase CysQ [Rhizomicrobium sp.]|nr:3'(2'),5'-bisphosphate nucleotidase CysQ [Rhizomicrobium sp.]
MMTDATRTGPSPDIIEIARIALRAGDIILRHYANTEIAARNKEDRSPVTNADEEAEAYILDRLRARAPDMPVIAEEEVSSGKFHEIGRRFFLVDPLDGTKEFLNRNGEFTVNIGEIADGRPIRGVVFAPAMGRLFLGDAASGAFELQIEPDTDPDFGKLRPISARSAPADGIVAVASRSHRDASTDEYLARFPVREFVSAGSSLKFCLVAAGEADIYPRLGRTMEWDTAAGHGVLVAAGGSVVTIDGRPFVYGKAEEKFANPFFVARGRT